MAKRKLSTAEILARARAEDAGEGKPEEAAAGEQTPQQESGAAQEPAAPEGEAAREPPAAEKPPAKPPAKPSSTKDILAAARAQDAGGGTAEEPAAEEKAEPATGASKPAGKPKSTKDILAAARAEAKGGGKPAAAEKPAAKPQPAAEKKSPKPPPSAKPAGQRPSVQEMLRAAREAEQKGRPPEAARPAPKEPAKPKKPAERKKPAARAGKQPDRGRRGALMALLLLPVALFSNAFAAAWTLFTAACAAFTLALARFMMPNVLVEPPSKFKVGQPSDYPPGTVSTKWKSQYGIWLVHNEYRDKSIIYALISVCTHLGCTPNWLEGEQKFKCPCHGSGFYITGINFEGPAPRPLERAAIRIAPDGLLEVDKSQSFQQEMGQWEDPASYVEVV